jgi:hypothetical protein
MHPAKRLYTVSLMGYRRVVKPGGAQISLSYNG